VALFFYGLKREKSDITVLIMELRFLGGFFIGNVKVEHLTTINKMDCEKQTHA
jgi:hypothetical protein